jgi:glycosyltransferase involved in cell wall biosynthesis
MQENREVAAVDDGRPVAYVTGEYLRVSHTFILREVAALREAGVDVRPCTIRAVPESQLVGDEQRAEHARTFHVLRAALRPWRLAADHARMMAASPRRYLSALALALRTGRGGASGLLFQVIYFLEAGVLARHLRDIRARHLHNHFGDSSCTVAMLAAALAAVPFSLTLHGPSIFYEPRAWRIDEKIARAAFVACISHFCRSQAMIFADQAHWRRLKIVRCGVLPERYGAGARKREGARLIFVGRLAAVKGLPVLIEALATVRAAHPDATLTLVGDGPDRAALAALAETVGVAKAVTFAGYRSQDEVARLLGEADVFVLPSFAEGVPVVLMEAMASGLPVVATRIAGVPELVEDGEHGLLAPPGDPDSLAAAIAALLSDPARRHRMGAAACARVAADYDARREAVWLAELFDAAAQGGLPDGRRPEPNRRTTRMAETAA